MVSPHELPPLPIDEGLVNEEDVFPPPQFTAVNSQAQIQPRDVRPDADPQTSTLRQLFDESLDERLKYLSPQRFAQSSLPVQRSVPTILEPSAPISHDARRPSPYEQVGPAQQEVRQTVMREQRAPAPQESRTPAIREHNATGRREVQEPAAGSIPGRQIRTPAPGASASLSLTPGRVPKVLQPEVRFPRSLLEIHKLFEAWKL